VLEEVLREASQIRLDPLRKKGSTRPLPASITSGQHDDRQRIETGGSLIERLLPTTIHAVTAAGFALTVFRLVLADSFNCL
jgi:hypothetical protein